MTTKRRRLRLLLAVSNTSSQLVSCTGREEVAKMIHGLIRRIKDDLNDEADA